MQVHFWSHGGVTRKVSEKEPIVMGHEAAGIVLEVGPSVKTLKPGDRVAMEPGFPCRRCKRCKAGRYQLCPEMRFAADPPKAHGALCRVYKAPEDFLYKLPDSVSLQEAVVAEPLSVAVHGVRLSGLQAGQSALILGSGTIGLLTAAMAKAYGAASVCITDISKGKLEFAKSFLPGCTPFLIDSAATSEVEYPRLMKAAEIEEGFDVVLECSGVESSANLGLYASIPGGVFVQIGMGKPKHLFPIAAMCEKETVLKTSFRYGAGDYDIALGMLGSGNVNVKSMISSVTPFERAPEAWEKTKRGEGIKNLIQVLQD